MRIQNIEFLRFLFAIVIVLFHMGYSSADGYLAVEMFLIMAGYFLAVSFKRFSDYTISDFMKLKFFRLWPLFAVAVILSGGNLYDMVLKLLFLHATGLSLKYQGYIWFVAPFFWAMVFYFIVLKHYGISRSVFAISIITYFCYVLLVNFDNGNFNIRQTSYGMISFSIVRVFGSIGLGILFYSLFAEMKKIMPSTYKPKNFIFIGIIESAILFFLIYNMLFHHLKYDNNLIFVIMFGAELFLFVERKGFLSRFLDKRCFGYCGRYAYAIYLMQNSGFDIAEKLYRQIGINYNMEALLKLLVVILLGIVGHYMVECSNWKSLFRRLAQGIKK